MPLKDILFFMTLSRKMLKTSLHCQVPITYSNTSTYIDHIIICKMTNCKRRYP